MDMLPIPTERATENTRSGSRIPRAFLPWILVIALFITNAVTLLNYRTQSASYDSVMSAMVAIFKDPIGLIFGNVSRREPISPLKLVEDLAKKNMMLAAHSNGLESELANLQRLNSQIKAQKLEVEQIFRKLQDEHIGLRIRHMALEKDRTALKEMSVRRAKAVRAVADRISRNLATHAGELIAELPLRAAPYVGVFTLVTGTAYDIKSDCELSQTLNGLVLEHHEAPLDTHAVCQYMSTVPSATQVWDKVKSRAGSFAVPAYRTVERLYRH